MRAQSKKRQADAPRRRKVREAVFRRDGGCVLRHTSEAGECMGELTPHHLLKSSHCGEYTEENLITLCSHHNCVWVEGNPIEAWDLGLVIRAGDTPMDALEKRCLHGLSTFPGPLECPNCGSMHNDQRGLPYYIKRAFVGRCCPFCSDELGSLMEAEH